MFVSVVIPTYNRAHLIGITLNSLINQTYSKEMFEMLWIIIHQIIQL